MFKFWSKDSNNDVVTETTPMLSNVDDVEKKSLRGGRLSRRWRVAREKIRKELRAPKEFVKFSESSVMSVWECTLIIAVYLSVGVIAFSYVFENWRIVDSLYFSAVTFTTVGYGDFSPTTQAGRLFCIFYAFTSVLFVSIALSFLTERMVEQKEAMKKVANEFKTNEMMKSFVSEHRSSILSADVSIHTEDEDDENAEIETNRKRIRLVLFLLLLVYSGGILLGQDNDWTFIDACYFTTITMTTIGYGDVTASDHTKWLAFLYIPFSVGVMGYILGELTTRLTEDRIHAMESKVINQKISLKVLQEMDENHDGKVDLLEYMEFMLVSLEKVDDELLNRIKLQFKSIDIDGSGFLDADDILAAAHRSHLKVNSERSSKKLSKLMRRASNQY